MLNDQLLQSKIFFPVNEDISKLCSRCVKSEEFIFLKLFKWFLNNLNLKCFLKKLIYYFKKNFLFYICDELMPKNYNRMLKFFKFLN